MAALEAMANSFVLADERTMQLLLASLCLVAVLLTAAGIIALVKRWRRQDEIKEDLSPNAQMAYFRSLHEAGTISWEEFERLRSVLVPRMRESLGVPPKTPAPSPPQTGIRLPDENIGRPKESEADGPPE